jgi:hypothetical protein
MDLDIASFRASFPAFERDDLYPDAMLNGKMFIAKCYIEDNQLTFTDECRQYAYQLMVAHLLSIAALVAEGQPGRLVTSAAEGPVNVSFAEPTNRSNFSFWLATTPYGNEISALLSINSIGDYYGGTNALQAYRRF